MYLSNIKYIQRKKNTISEKQKTIKTLWSMAILLCGLQWNFIFILF